MRRTASALLLAALLTGCTSSGPDVPEESEFADGTCRTAAPDVRAVGEVLPRLGDGGTVPDDVKQDLRDTQQRLVALAEGAEPALEPDLTALVQAIGAVRIRADGGTFDAEVGDILTRAYERVLDACGAGTDG